MIKMTGHNEFGDYMTKEDKIEDAKKALKKWKAELSKANSYRQSILASEEITRLEHKLHSLGLTYDEIEEFMYS